MAADSIGASLVPMAASPLQGVIHVGEDHGYHQQAEEGGGNPTLAVTNRLGGNVTGQRRDEGSKTGCF